MPGRMDIQDGKDVFLPMEFGYREKKTLAWSWQVQIHASNNMSSTTISRQLVCSWSKSNPMSSITVNNLFVRGANSTRHSQLLSPVQQMNRYLRLSQIYLFTEQKETTNGRQITHQFDCLYNYNKTLDRYQQPLFLPLLFLTTCLHLDSLAMQTWTSSWAQETS